MIRPIRNRLEERIPKYFLVFISQGQGLAGSRLEPGHHFIQCGSLIQNRDSLGGFEIVCL